MNLVFHQVVQLEHIDGADAHLLLERLARPPVVQARLAVAGQPGAAIESLLRGESVEPREARIPYARATILARLGQRNAAAAAARRALEIDPAHADARRLLQQLGE